jgi:hypothetical protein
MRCCVKTTRLLVLLALSLPLFATESGDIRLADGRVLKAARVLSIGETQVAIVHAGGITGVARDAVPLEVLARAHMALEATAIERRKKDEALRVQASKRIEDAKAKHEEEIKIRLAEASVRENQGTPYRLQTDAALLELKAKFPPKRQETVMVHVDGRHLKNRQAVEIEIPATDLWLYYHEMVQGTTAQALPVTLKRIGERVQSDLAELEKKGGARNDETARVKASKSAAWIIRELRPFLLELHALRGL